MRDISKIIVERSASRGAIRAECERSGERAARLRYSDSASRGVRGAGATLLHGNARFQRTNAAALKPLPALPAGWFRGVVYLPLPHRHATRAHHRLTCQRHLLGKHSASCEIIAGMLQLATPVGFLPTTDLDRARTFYEHVLGLPVINADSFAVVVQTGRITIRLTNVGDQLRPQVFTVFGWEVDDLRAEMAELAGRGVDFLRVDGLEQDDFGVWTAPGGSLIAWFKDPDGNTLSLATHNE